MDKVNKAYENNWKWDYLDNNVVFRDVNNKEYTAKQLNLEEKYEHIKSYFPGVSKIRVNEEHKHIVMDFLEMGIVSRRYY